jgi:alpha-tubulin suppressor-like RCC1 family protein
MCSKAVSCLPLCAVLFVACSDPASNTPPQEGGGPPPADGAAPNRDGSAGPDGPAPLRWLSVSAGGAHTCAVRSDGTAWCWGSNSNGQLGNGSSASSPAPVRVVGLSGVTQVAADWVHSCAVTSDGSAYCWGENDGMQIGDPKAEASYPGCVSGGCTEPVKVVQLSDVVAVGTGGRHSCAIVKSGQPYCWGFNELGQLGDGKMPNDSASPSPVVGLGNAASISGSPWHTCAGTKDGKALCWGDNTDGNLGVEDPAESDKPLAVAIPNVAAVVAGDTHTCALTQGGRVLCFGGNAAGQLGDGTTDDSPAAVEAMSGGRAVSTTVDHSCAVDDQGAVWCWGSNGTDNNSDGVPETTTGKLGQPLTVKSSLKPQKVAGVTDAAAVATGDDHTCALTSAGAIWCWGENADGQLGSASAATGATPVQVPVPTSE